MHWKIDKHLAIGISEIDDQHQDLIEKLNYIIDGLSRNEPYRIISKYLFQLIESLQNHYKCEEGYFELYQYPDSLDHIESHKRLLKNLRCYASTTTFDDTQMSIGTVRLISDYIIEHILGYDMLFKDYIQKQCNVIPLEVGTTQ